MITTKYHHYKKQMRISYEKVTTAKAFVFQLFYTEITHMFKKYIETNIH